MRNINQGISQNNRQEAQRQFIAALEAHRLKLSEPLIADGEFHRCDATNKPGKSGNNDGQYILHLDGVPRGAFINRTTDNGQWHTWSLKSARLSHGEREELDTAIKAEMAKARAALAEAHEKARKTAVRLWDLAEDASDDHPYAVAKQVEPHGLRCRNDNLLVPMWNEKGKLQSLQFIQVDGGKSFLEGGRVKGCHYWVMTPKEADSDTICVCEGWATGESIYQATKYAVLVAFDAGNLKAVAKWAREKYPEARIILCADDDWKSEGNPGVTAAQEAARAIDGLVAMPEFDDDRATKDSDFNDMAASVDADAVKAAIDAATVPESEEEEEEEAHVRANQADALIALASDADLFHDDAIGYADIVVHGHRESWSIRSKPFRDWLLYRYYSATHMAPSSGAMQLAIDTIGAKARFEGPQRQLFVRIGGHKGKIYLDLCNKQWQAVEIDSKGWRVVDKPPVRFRRAPGVLPLPVPMKGGSVDDLRPYVNVEDDVDFILLVSWLLASYRERGPYPALAVKGAEGSAKTTLVDVLCKLVDPKRPKERRVPRDDRDLFIHASKSHVVAFGNVSDVPDWLSDSLCNLATGGGFATRTLYTDDEEMLFEATRPVVLNGIEFATRSDLADRLIVLKLPPIRDDKFRTEQKFWAEFEAKRPQIIGALLDVVAHGLRELPHTPIDGAYPRMADFAHWITACAGAFCAAGEFRAAYANNRSAATLDVIEANPVATALRTFVQQLAARKKEMWEGTATDLLDKLDVVVGEKESKRKHWPGSAAVLGQRLRRIKKRLEQNGITVDFADRHAKQRLIKLTWDFPVIGVTAVISEGSQSDSDDSGNDSRASGAVTDDSRALRTGNAVTTPVIRKPLKHKKNDSNDSNDSSKHTFVYRPNMISRERRIQRAIESKNRGDA